MGSSPSKVQHRSRSGYFFVSTSTISSERAGTSEDEEELGKCYSFFDNNLISWLKNCCFISVYVCVTLKYETMQIFLPCVSKNF